uniref:Uncharacterized protein n=2 Tax=Guillardia theta TaxID=55529 RepID=A0A7S4KH80_GUITH|mmetsp:Transcript_24716/g.81059  ORF Transcript_24716/g.81059 Transcript_24716/m.81059 type:complete len:321 (+) Transcript_24716:299-1261(+)
MEVQNQGLREENALSFTKMYQKLESTSTSDGLQKEFMMLKEESDNRMLILENLMREIGGDKVKGMINDISSLQHDTVALWKENARMVLEMEHRAHHDEVQEIRKQLREVKREVEVVRINSGEEAEQERRKEISDLKDSLCNLLSEAELSSRLVKSSLERADELKMKSADTDRVIDNLKLDIGEQAKNLVEAQNLVRALLGAQKRFAVELDDLGTSVRQKPDETMDLAMTGSGKNIMRPHSAQAVTFNLPRSSSPEEEDRPRTSLGFSNGPSNLISHFPPGKVRRPNSAMLNRPTSARSTMHISELTSDENKNRRSSHSNR